MNEKEVNTEIWKIVYKNGISIEQLEQAQKAIEILLYGLESVGLVERWDIFAENIGE